MKSSFLLSIIALTAAGALNAPQAQAAEPQERGARWAYAPNVWKVEQPRIPGQADGPRAVRQGAMPHSSNFLGVDPGMLSHPAPAPRVAARPVPTSEISHKLFVPNTAFKTDFGKPVQPLQAGEPVKMATLPPGAGSPIPMAAPPVAKPASVPVHHAISSAPHHHSTGVTGRLRTPIHSHGNSAPPPQVASYNSGYMPGTMVPAQSGVGMRTNSTVSGQLVHPVRH